MNTLKTIQAFCLIIASCSPPYVWADLLVNFSGKTYQLQVPAPELSEDSPSTIFIEFGEKIDCDQMLQMDEWSSHHQSLQKVKETLTPDQYEIYSVKKSILPDSEEKIRLLLVYLQNGHIHVSFFLTSSISEVLIASELNKKTGQFQTLEREGEPPTRWRHLN